MNQLPRIQPLTLLLAFGGILVFASLPRFSQAQTTDAGKVELAAKNASVFGERLAFDSKSNTIRGQIKAEDSIDWSFQVEKPGWYQVVVHYSLPKAIGSKQAGFNATIGDQNRLGPIHATGKADRFLPQVLFDPVNLPKGVHQLKLQLVGVSRLSDMQIQRVEMVKAPEPGVP